MCIAATAIIDEEEDLKTEKNKMKKMIFLLSLLAAIVISGCASGQGASGGYERPSGHSGHYH